MKTAYLVAHVQLDSAPYSVFRCGIYSESSATLTGAKRREEWAFDVAAIDGDDFESAVANLLTYCLRFEALYAWALDMVPEHQKRWGKRNNAESPTLKTPPKTLGPTLWSLLLATLILVIAAATQLIAYTP